MSGGGLRNDYDACEVKNHDTFLLVCQRQSMVVYFKSKDGIRNFAPYTPSIHTPPCPNSFRPLPFDLNLPNGVDVCDVLWTGNGTNCSWRRPWKFVQAVPTCCHNKVNIHVSARVLKCEQEYLSAYAEFRHDYPGRLMGVSNILQKTVEHWIASWFTTVWFFYVLVQTIWTNYAEQLTSDSICSLCSDTLFGPRGQLSRGQATMKIIELWQARISIQWSAHHLPHLRDSHGGLPVLFLASNCHPIKTQSYWIFLIYSLTDD